MIIKLILRYGGKFAFVPLTPVVFTEIPVEALPVFCAEIAVNTEETLGLPYN